MKLQTNETSTNFDEVLSLIVASKQKALAQVNSILIELYWRIGEYISAKTIKENWGKGVVIELVQFIQNKEPNIQGFTERNLWRMKQFYETYKDNSKLTPLVTQILNLSIKERYLFQKRYYKENLMSFMRHLR
jgi:hypothetical protein